MRADTSKKISRGLELELCSSIFQRRLQELEDRLRASREFSANLALEIKINRLREETWWTDRILDWSEEKETIANARRAYDTVVRLLQNLPLDDTRTCTGPGLSPDLLL